jgi:hypothetical protein
MQFLFVPLCWFLLLASEMGSVVFFWFAENFAAAEVFNPLFFLLVPVPGYVGHLLFTFALRGLQQSGVNIPVAQAYLALVGTALVLTAVFALDLERRTIFPRLSGELSDVRFWLCLIVGFAGMGGAKVIASFYHS